MPTESVVASGGLSNSIGMNTTSWADCFQCSSPGACTAVVGTDPYNQFQPFQGQTLSSLVSNKDDSCQFLPHSPYSTLSKTGSRNIQSVACLYSQSLLQINITVNGTLFGLQENHPHANIEIDNYTVTWLEQSITAAINVGAYNAGTLMGTIRLSALQCCLSKADQLACQELRTTDSGWVTIGPLQHATLLANVSVTDGISLTQAACDYAVVDESENVQLYVSIPLNSLKYNEFSSKNTSAAAPNLPPTVSYAILSFMVTLMGNNVAVDNDVLIVR